MMDLKEWHLLDAEGRLGSDRTIRLADALLKLAHDAIGECFRRTESMEGSDEAKKVWHLAMDRHADRSRALAASVKAHGDLPGEPEGYGEKALLRAIEAAGAVQAATIARLDAALVDARGK